MVLRTQIASLRKENKALKVRLRETEDDLDDAEMQLEQEISESSESSKRATAQLNHMRDQIEECHARVQASAL